MTSAKSSNKTQTENISLSWLPRLTAVKICSKGWNRALTSSCQNQSTRAAGQSTHHAARKKAVRFAPNDDAAAEDLAHMLIHDMRNPLTSATLYNNILLKRNQLSMKDQEYATKVRESLRNLAGFLDEILTVAKMEEGMLKLSCVPENVNSLVSQVGEIHHDLANLHGFQLALDLPEEIQFFSLDAPLFKRVLDNLLSNAFKYAPENSLVQVKLRFPTETAVSPPTLSLQIIDEGPGIAPENLERIFNRYEVVELSQSGHQQVGLGLAFCKMVVEAHGGRIFAASNNPHGAIFTIEMQQNI